MIGDGWRNGWLGLYHLLGVDELCLLMLVVVEQQRLLGRHGGRSRRHLLLHGQIGGRVGGDGRCGEELLVLLRASSIGKCVYVGSVERCVVEALVAAVDQRRAISGNEVMIIISIKFIGLNNK